MATVPSTASAPAAKVLRTRRALIVLMVMVIAVFAAYVTGRLQGSAGTKAAEQRAASAEQAQSKLAERISLLEARRRLHLAEVALDQRNFGIAESQVTAAAELLAKSKADGGLAELRASIAQSKLRASEDVGAERKKVEGWISKIDELVPP